MVRFLLRSLLPRVSAPLLPVSRRPLTNVARSARLFSHFPARLDASEPNPSSKPSEPANQTLSQRLRHLIKSYGWYALGVYFLVSTLDLGVAFAGVSLVGTERVAHVANSVKHTIQNAIHSKPPEPGRDELDSADSGQDSNSGLYAMLVLAYTVHKLFLPIRVGLTAWLTPRLVGWLRLRGWAGGAGTLRAASEMRQRFRAPKAAKRNNNPRT